MENLYASLALRATWGWWTRVSTKVPLPPNVHYMSVTIGPDRKPRVIQQPDNMLRAISALSRMAALLTICDIRQEYRDKLKVFVDARQIIKGAINQTEFQKLVGESFEGFVAELEGVTSYVGTRKRPRQQKHNMRKIASKTENLAAILNEEMIEWIKAVLPIIAKYAPPPGDRKVKVPI